MRRIKKTALYLLLISLIGFPAFLNTEKVMPDDVTEEQIRRADKKGRKMVV